MRRPPRWTGWGFLHLKRIREQCRAAGVSTYLDRAVYESAGDNVRIKPRRGPSFVVDRETLQIISVDDGQPDTAFPDSADDRVAYAETAELADVEALLADEQQRSRPRKTVIAACEQRLKY